MGATQLCKSKDRLHGFGGVYGVSTSGVLKRQAEPPATVPAAQLHGRRETSLPSARRQADSKVWFTVAKGITSEVFYPRLDIPNMEDMQYIITDGSTFVDLERDATSHAISMPAENALEYTVTNTDKRPSPKYRITNTYITDPSRDTLLIRTRFESLDGGVYRLYLLANPAWPAAARTTPPGGTGRTRRSWPAGREPCSARPRRSSRR